MAARQEVALTDPGLARGNEIDDLARRCTIRAPTPDATTAFGPARDEGVTLPGGPAA